MATVPESRYSRYAEVIKSDDGNDYGIYDYEARRAIESISPADAVPLMDGTAAVGSSTDYAREDHVHPTDTSRQATLVSGTNIKTINGNSILGSGDVTITSVDEKVSQIQTTSGNSYYKLLLSENTNNVTETAKARKNPYLTFNPNTTELVVGSIDNGTIIQPNSVTLMDSSYMSTVTATKVQDWNSAWSWIQGNGTAALSDNKVAQNNSTADNDFRVLLSNTASDSNATATANKSAGLRFMPSTNHLYVGSSGNDGYISISPRVYLGTLPAYYNQDGSESSEAAYGFGLGINNPLSYTNYFTTSSLRLQHWNAQRPSGGVPSSTNYVQREAYLNPDTLIIRRYSGKNTLSTSATLSDTVLTFTNSAGTEFTVTPTKINKWDNYTDTKNTAGSTNTSSKIFLVGATSQATNPVTYSHDTAYVGTDGHLYSNSRQVVNVSNTQTLTNKTLTEPILNQPAVSSVELVMPQSSFWTVNSTTTESVTAFAAYRWGNLISVRMNIKTTSTVDTGTTATLGTVGANYKSATLVYANTRSHTAPYAPYTGGSVWITGDTISCRLPASTWVNLSLVYLINPDA